MSDLLEDQKIHYIVKDYRRMLEMHEQLVKACKEASEAIEKRDKKILSLEAKLNKKGKSSYNVALDYIRRAKDQLVSIECRARKGQEILDGLIEVCKPFSDVDEDTSNIV